MKPALIFTLLLTASLPAHAVDGEILITQAKALAGNVSPGDTPGFPVTLSIPGKYKLAGSLNVPGNTHGIEISSDFVTLDLNGFGIFGPVVCTNDATNMVCMPNGNTVAVLGQNRIGTTVRNGFVNGFDWGVNGLGDTGLAEDLAISDISSTAISMGSGGIARGNRLYRVRGGISSAGLVLNNAARLIGHTGIYLHTGGLAIGNRVSFVGSTGIDAYAQGNAAAVVHNSVTSDYGPGDGITSGVSLGGSDTSNLCEFQAC